MEFFEKRRLRFGALSRFSYIIIALMVWISVMSVRFAEIYQHLGADPPMLWKMFIGIRKLYYIPIAVLAFPIIYLLARLDYNIKNMRHRFWAALLTILLLSILAALVVFIIVFVMYATSGLMGDGNNPIILE